MHRPFLTQASAVGPVYRAYGHVSRSLHLVHRTIADDAGCTRSDTLQNTDPPHITRTLASLPIHILNALPSCWTVYLLSGHTPSNCYTHSSSRCNIRSTSFCPRSQQVEAASVVLHGLAHSGSPISTGSPLRPTLERSPSTLRVHTHLSTPVRSGYRLYAHTALHSDTFIPASKTLYFPDRPIKIATVSFITTPNR